MAFFFDWQTFFHGGYVAFVFGVLFLGSLAFRQVVDNLEVKRLQLGEDRESFLDAAWVWSCSMVWVGIVLLAVFVYGRIAPSIYIYALPLILAMQLLQISLRTWFQQALVKTRGIVIRSIVVGKVRGVPFAEIVMVRLISRKMWVDVRIGLENEEVGFRIFSFSAPSLERLLQSSCHAPVLWISNSMAD